MSAISNNPESSSACMEHASNTQNQFNRMPPLPPEQEAGIGRVPSNCFYSVFIFENTPCVNQQLVDAVRKTYPDAREETPEETARHRAWFAAETGGFNSDLAADEQTTALYFRAPVTEELLQFPPPLTFAKDLIDGPGRGQTIGFATIDTRRVPSAVAVAICAGSDKGIVG